jgi:hypothetical protein
VQGPNISGANLQVRKTFVITQRFAFSFGRLVIAVTSLIHINRQFVTYTAILGGPAGPTASSVLDAMKGILAEATTPNDASAVLRERPLSVGPPAF